MKLTEFSGFLPLGPGDVLLVNDKSVVSGIQKLADHFIAEAYVDMSLPQDRIETHVARWTQATHAQAGMHTAFVAAETYRWLRDEVAASEHVESMHLLRSPGGPLNLGRPHQGGEHLQPTGLNARQMG